jgi:hypothetical protein
MAWHVSIRGVCAHNRAAMHRALNAPHLQALRLQGCNRERCNPRLHVSLLQVAIQRYFKRVGEQPRLSVISQIRCLRCQMQRGVPKTLLCVKQDAYPRPDGEVVNRAASL